MSVSVTPNEEKMYALYVNKWCDQGTVPDTMLFGEIPVPPAPKKREVLIGVKASAINVDDIFLMQDTAGGGWFYHTRKPTAANPLVGGQEYSGVVLACGPDCQQLKVGDRVCGIQNIASQKWPGTWAEQTLAPETDVVPIPADMELSFVEAAAIPMGAFVSGDMYKRAKLENAKRCLVLGASGGLGTVLLQLLRQREGLHITAVCSGTNAEMVRRLGADEVVDYKTAPFGEQLAGAEKFDIVFDYVGGQDMERNAMPLLRRRGQFITAVGPMQGIGDRQLSCCEWTGSLCSLIARVMSCCCCCKWYGYKYEMSGDFPPLKPETFNKYVVEAGARAEIALEVSFTEEQLREALRKSNSRHPGGKIVINMERTGA